MLERLHRPHSSTYYLPQSPSKPTTIHTTKNQRNLKRHHPSAIFLVRLLERNPFLMFTVSLALSASPFTFLRLCALTNLTTFASWGCFSRNDCVLKFHSYDIRPAAFGTCSCMERGRGSQAFAVPVLILYYFHDHTCHHSALRMGMGYLWHVSRCCCCSHNDGLAHSTRARPTTAVTTEHTWCPWDGMVRRHDFLCMFGQAMVALHG